MQLVQTESIGRRVVDVVDFTDMFEASAPRAWRNAQHIFAGDAWNFTDTLTHSLSRDTPVLYQFSDGTYGVSEADRIDAALEACQARREP